MDTSDDSLHQKLSITKQNRHQYLETQFVTAGQADREITMAEARGRERRLREQALQKKLIRIGWVLLAGAVCLAVTVLLKFYI